MISKSLIKWVKQLHLKKQRSEQQLFIAEGEKIVKELMVSDFVIHSLYAIDGWGEIDAAHLETDFQVVSEKELKEISLLETPNKVLAVVEQKKAVAIDIRGRR